MGLVEIFPIWLTCIMIIWILGQGLKSIRRTEENARNKYYHRHQDINFAVRLRSPIGMDPSDNAVDNYARELYAEYEQDYRDFFGPVRSKNRLLKKVILGLLMLCDSVVFFALFFWIL